MTQLKQLLTNIYSCLQRILSIISLDSKKYLSVDEVAEYLSLSRHTIYKYCSDRKIPHIKFHGNNLFNRSHIDDWILKNSYNAQTDTDIETSAKEYIANK